jgi:hypothetical protein
MLKKCVAKIEAKTKTISEFKGKIELLRELRIKLANDSMKRRSLDVDNEDSISVENIREAKQLEVNIMLS